MTDMDRAVLRARLIDILSQREAPGRTAKERRFVELKGLTSPEDMANRILRPLRGTRINDVTLDFHVHYVLCDHGITEPCIAPDAYDIAKVALAGIAPISPDAPRR
jgi:hypothetical protein